jgi:hypothetical protein
MKTVDDHWEGGLKQHPYAVAPAKLIPIVLVSHSLGMALIAILIRLAFRVPMHDVWIDYLILNACAVVAAAWLVWAHQAPGPRALAFRMGVGSFVYFESFSLACVVAANRAGLLCRFGGLAFWLPLSAICFGAVSGLAYVIVSRLRLFADPGRSAAEASGARGQTTS